MKKILITLILASSVMGSANASFLGDVGDWVSGAVEHAATEIGDLIIVTKAPPAQSPMSLRKSAWTEVLSANIINHIFILVSG
jgi:hypothetical protein